MFKDRVEAGELLAAKLKKYKNEKAIVIAIPRGGVPLGYVIAKKLNLPLEIALSKKIGHPLNEEYAIGAVTLKNMVLSDSSLIVSNNYIEEEVRKIRAILAERYNEYYGEKTPLELKDKILIVVDDGIATGNTILSTIGMLHEEKPKKIVIAIPVASQSALQKLQKSAFINEIVCLLSPVNFHAVGQFYDNFDQVDDLKVQTFLNKTVLD